MGSKKSHLAEGINEGSERGKSAVNEGTDILGDGREIDGYIENLNRDIDEDDANAIDVAKSGYKSDFKEAFDSRAAAMGMEAIQIEKSVKEMAETEQKKVEDIKGDFEKMEEASDIGKENAERGKDIMEKSAQEYMEDINKANELADAIDNSLNRLDSELGSLF